MSYSPGHVGAKAARTSAAAVDTRASAIRFRDLGGRPRRSIHINEKFTIEVVMRGLLPDHRGVIKVLVSRRKRDWSPSVVRLYRPRSPTDYTFVNDALEDDRPISLVVGNRLTAEYKGRQGDESYTTRSGPLLITARPE